MTRADGPWWRIDADAPSAWTWDAFPTPRHRFDPPSGRFRVRYAASGALPAARERFLSGVLTEPDGELLLVRLDGSPAALHLAHQTNLDALGLDDRISTGHLDLDRARDPDPLLDTCGRLSDAVFDWWDGVPPPLVYRTRTTPAARSIAFTRSTELWPTTNGRLRDATSLLAALVLRAGFVVPEHWLH